MNSILKMLLPLFVGPISGFVTTYVMDFIDDTLKWTANWPDQVKQAAVLVLSALIPVANAQWGITLPNDPSQLATQPVVQMIVGAAVAFLVKHTNTVKTTSTVIPSSK